MNEKETCQEKDLRSILNAMNELGEVRIKLICEIDDIIDRIKHNRGPSAEPRESTVDEKSDVFIPLMNKKLGEAERDNERLRMICNRLNEFI